MKILLWVLAACLLAGCPKAKYQDASGAEEYSGLVGSRYHAKVDLILHGVTYDKGANKTIDEFVITNKPGFDGPEVMTHTTLRAGTVIWVKRALVCTNCLHSALKFEVEVLPAQTDPSIPLSLRGVAGGVIESRDGRISLSSHLFAKAAPQ